MSILVQQNQSTKINRPNEIPNHLEPQHKAKQYTLDWQLHNDQWITLFSGSLNECLQHMNERDEWFE